MVCDSFDRRCASVCAALPQNWIGQVFPPTQSTSLPPPVAFFPLTEGQPSNVLSYPDGLVSGVANFSAEYGPSLNRCQTVSITTCQDYRGRPAVELFGVELRCSLLPSRVS